MCSHLCNRAIFLFCNWFFRILIVALAQRGERNDQGLPERPKYHKPQVATFSLKVSLWSNSKWINLYDQFGFFAFNGISTFVGYLMPKPSLDIFTNTSERSGCDTRSIFNHFPSPKSVAIPRLKSPVCLTIYP